MPEDGSVYIIICLFEEIVEGLIMPYMYAALLLSFLQCSAYILSGYLCVLLCCILCVLLLCYFDYCAFGLLPFMQCRLLAFDRIWRGHPFSPTGWIYMDQASSMFVRCQILFNSLAPCEKKWTSSRSGKLELNWNAGCLYRRPYKHTHTKIPYGKQFAKKHACLRARSDCKFLLGSLCCDTWSAPMQRLHLQ